MSRASRLPRPLRALGAARDGMAAVEFAIVAPVFLLLLLGAMDTAFNLYMIATLQGSVQKAARDSTLQDYTSTTAEAALDAKVRGQIQSILSAATVTTTRRYYKDYFTAAAKTPETFTDTNKDGTCDNNEPYLDSNGNGAWDADGANGGGGGAQDKTVYTVVVTYPDLLPLWRWIGGTGTVRLNAATVLANQPYGDQSTYSAGTWKHCT